MRTIVLWQRVTEGHSLDRAGDSLEMKCRHDVLVAIANERRENLTIARNVSEMTDSLGNHMVRLSTPVETEKF